MTRRMLINASHREECRVAVTENDRLVELEVEREDLNQLKGNIYKATIARIEPSLQAAFLDIGSTRNGFLQINDINPSYFNNWPPEDEAAAKKRPAIESILSAGQDLVVQVVKDERDAKGATLTTNLSIPGRYLVLMVGNQRGGVSRKIADSRERSKLRRSLEGLKIPIGMSVIIRTAGIGKSQEELQGDLDALLDMWKELIEKSKSKKTPIPLYEERSLAIRTIRDFLTQKIEEILIDDQTTFETVKAFITRSMPAFIDKLKLYQEPKPIFSFYHLDTQVDEISHPEVKLPSGGSIVIHQTEAVVTVDVNSGRSTSQRDVEETAFQTNKEAAEIIGLQLRLRDLGGLVVVDFIDMIDRRHKIQVEKILKDAVKTDKAKVEIGRISKFGLLEMSRQRLKTSVESQNHTSCSHCEGSGRVKTIEACALEVLRKIQSAVFAGRVGQIRAHVTPRAAWFLLNEKRSNLSNLEKETGCTIMVFPDARMTTEHYELEIQSAEGETRKETDSSYLQEGKGRRGGRSLDKRGKGRNRKNPRRKNDRHANRNKDREKARVETKGEDKEESQKLIPTKPKETAEKTAPKSPKPPKKETIVATDSAVKEGPKEAPAIVKAPVEVAAGE